MEYTYLRNSHVEEIAAIISTNYKKAGLELPTLSGKYERTEMHIKEIEKYVDDSSFIVATESGRVVGFMGGYGINNFKGTVKGLLSKPSFHGIAGGCDKGYLYSELYRRASEQWVSSGCYTHAIMLYVNDMDTTYIWMMNGFGMLVLDVVRPLEKIDIPDHDGNISIRKATAEDLADMEPLFRGLDEHLASPPIFLYNDGSASYVEEYREWLKTEGNILWIAELDNKITGYLKTNTTEINTDELQDGYTMGINGAYTLPEYRSRHIMAVLLNAATDWALEKGLKRCSTDFEAANIDGRRFWLKHFTPYCHSMIRRIDERNHLRQLGIGGK